jgi:hypothetical protein
VIPARNLQGIKEKKLKNGNMGISNCPLTANHNFVVEGVLDLHDHKVWRFLGGVKAMNEG